MSILATLAFNILVATLYLIAFWLIKKFCSKTANEKADELISRRSSKQGKGSEVTLYQELNELIRDGSLQAKIQEEIDSRRCSSNYNLNLRNILEDPINKQLNIVPEAQNEDDEEDISLPFSVQIIGDKEINSSSNNSIDFANEEQKMPLLQDDYFEKEMQFNSVSGLKMSELTINNKNDEKHQSMEP